MDLFHLSIYIFCCYINFSFDVFVFDGGFVVFVMGYVSFIFLCDNKVYKRGFYIIVS